MLFKGVLTTYFLVVLVLQEFCSGHPTLPDQVTSKLNDTSTSLKQNKFGLDSADLRTKLSKSLSQSPPVSDPLDEGNSTNLNNLANDAPPEIGYNQTFWNGIPGFEYITMLTNTTVHGEFVKKYDNVFIMYYADGCWHSLKARRAFTKAAILSRHEVKFGAVDCKYNRETEKVCRSLGKHRIKMFPTFYLYVDGYWYGEYASTYLISLAEKSHNSHGRIEKSNNADTNEATFNNI
ncbi:uncharacterized protein LOC110853414 [Folsomia candida]|uniref:Protein disulfide-isomerase n=1 Tax=Folsomia candida TaxID=158441 RepID=A0A226E2A2_FOLCA|nr:uncharacterized protein LOC110853414 [Folsomia candida]OXA50606.1 Protein disulfide-isomerase [Folsomia candida]